MLRRGARSLVEVLAQLLFDKMRTLEIQLWEELSEVVSCVWVNRLNVHTFQMMEDALFKGSTVLEHSAIAEMAKDPYARSHK